jgi:hypothetical protein
MELLNLAGFLINRFMGVFRIVSGVFQRRRHEAAATSPESANACKAYRDGLLMFLIQVLAEV